VAYAPGFDRLFVTSGETGVVSVFEGADLARAKEIALDSDADNIRYEPTKRELYVGFGNGGLGRVAVDGVFYDARRRQLYVSCGDGALDVLALAQAAPNRIGRLTTAAGARTSLFVPAQDRLYVAVPHRGRQPAEILVYQPTF
jgi:hypothetical protein